MKPVLPRLPIREGLPALPASMEHLPRDFRGFPVPFFVPWNRAKGQWDFQAVSPERIRQAVVERRCWICGNPLFRNKAFILGSMCAITRTVSEPPSHSECAGFAVRSCPFLVRPRMRRAPIGDHIAAPGVMLDRNPGVSLLWVCRRFEPFRVVGGMLFKVGDPVRVEAWCEGRLATPGKLEVSLAGGLPTLIKLAEEDERQAPGALAKLDAMIRAARELLDLEEAPA